jgi:hypothetical protein
MTQDDSKNTGKIILDLCGGTGSWSKPYKEAGYDVRVITLPGYDVLNYEPPENVYGILAAPTCTMFSLARTTAKTPRNFDEGMELVEACLRIIWQCRKSGSLRFWALENPMGLLRQFLGRPPHTFNPVDYGDRHTKKTDLWGYYNEPRKKPIKLTDEEIRRMSINNRVLPELPADYVLPQGFSRQAARRSMTPPNFAKAFMEANL